MSRSIGDIGAATGHPTGARIQRRQKKEGRSGASRKILVVEDRAGGWRRIKKAGADPVSLDLLFGVDGRITFHESDLRSSDQALTHTIVRLLPLPSV